jgi:Family of unknown function (DUF6788)
MECRQRYVILTQSLARIGFVWPGTVQQQMLTCGKPQCACHKDPEARHGPYYYWTSKKKGKTVSKKLSREEAEILESWIKNRRTIDATIKRMMKESEHALGLTLRTESNSR